jgi:hypothetical protein
MTGRDASSQALLTSLQECLRNLRQPWPQQWPGVEQVLSSCWARLGLPGQDLTPRTAALQSWALEVVRQVEHDGRQQSALSREPAYHNRLHISDTLVCMTHLLLSVRALGLPGGNDVHAQSLCLAVMAGHDFLHPGGSNAFPAQFERLALQALTPLMQQAQLHDADRDAVTQIILMTDPLCVKSSHQAVAQRPFDLRDIAWTTVLVQEADILASTLPETQESLTLSLSREWAPSNPEAAAHLLRSSSRVAFLEHAALFSSPAARYLGLEQVKARQLSALRRQMQAAHN